jgi:hypothetical protein
VIVAVVATETWTGSNGAAWPGQWTTQLGTAAVADIQTNEGRLLTSTAAYSAGANALLSGMTAIADSEAYAEILFQNPLTEQYGKVAVRVSGLPAAATTDYPPNGYFAEIYPNASGSWNVQRVVGSTKTSLATAAYTTTAGTAVAVRLRVVGSVVSFRIWNVGSSEPGTWTYTGTDGTPYSTAGKVFMSAQNGGSTGAKAVIFDNLSVDDTTTFLAPPPYTIQQAVNRSYTY